MLQRYLHFDLGDVIDSTEEYAEPKVAPNSGKVGVFLVKSRTIKRLSG